jgi:hypothetical protein
MEGSMSLLVATKGAAEKVEISASNAGSVIKIEVTATLATLL